MSDFKLGDRVTMIGTVRKRKSYDSDDYSAKLTTGYEEEPLPKIWNRTDGTEYSEGFIVGRRFLQEGHTDHSGYEGERVFRSNGKTHRVWLVAFDLRYKPVMCFDHQISKEEK